MSLCTLRYLLTCRPEPARPEAGNGQRPYLRAVLAHIEAVARAWADAGDGWRRRQERAQGEEVRPCA